MAREHERANAEVAHDNTDGVAAESNANDADMRNKKVTKTVNASDKIAKGKTGGPRRRTKPKAEESTVAAAGGGKTIAGAKRKRGWTSKAVEEDEEDDGEETEEKTTDEVRTPLRGREKSVPGAGAATKAAGESTTKRRKAYASMAVEEDEEEDEMNVEEEGGEETGRVPEPETEDPEQASPAPVDVAVAVARKAGLASAVSSREGKRKGKSRPAAADSKHNGTKKAPTAAIKKPEKKKASTPTSAKHAAVSPSPVRSPSPELEPAAVPNASVSPAPEKAASSPMGRDGEHVSARPEGSKKKNVKGKGRRKYENDGEGKAGDAQRAMWERDGEEQGRKTKVSGVCDVMSFLCAYVCNGEKRLRIADKWRSEERFFPSIALPWKRLGTVGWRVLCAFLFRV